jgi:ketosteroid isomerase-like protein
MSTQSSSTQDVAQGWFDSLSRGDFDTALALVAEDVEWQNIPSTPGVSDVAPWLGTYHGLPQVLESFKVWASKSEMKAYELLDLRVAEDEAVGIVHEHARCLANGNEYDLYVATCLKVRDGKIASWKVYWDPSPLIAAYRGISVEAGK